MKINSKINLKLTQESGQTSQPPWKLVNNSYCAVKLINQIPTLLKVSQSNNKYINSLDFEYKTLSKINNINVNSKDIDKNVNNENNSLNNETVKNEIVKIFDLDFDLEKFYKFLSEDEKLKPAIKFCDGLRLFLAKDPFECIISSIASANNSITRWTNSIAKIATKWGNSYNFNNEIFYTFPSPKTLLNVHEDETTEFEYLNNNKKNSYTIDDTNKYNNKNKEDLAIENCINNLKSCGVGYRAPYIKKASEIFCNIDVLDIAKMNYDEAFEEILKVPGVGPKVADCILLYGYGFKEAFPTDVWIKRIVSYLYFDGNDVSVKKVRDFGMEYFEDYAGYAQLYLFHYARKSGLMSKLK
jgi:N-glycosylase/DNA lyase